VTVGFSRRFSSLELLVG